MISILIHTNLHKNVRIDAGKIVIVIIFEDSQKLFQEFNSKIRGCVSTQSVKKIVQDNPLKLIRTKSDRLEPSRLTKRSSPAIMHTISITSRGRAIAARRFQDIDD